jgi:hypothetical protein
MRRHNVPLRVQRELMRHASIQTINEHPTRWRRDQAKLLLQGVDGSLRSGLELRNLLVLLAVGVCKAPNVLVFPFRLASAGTV